MEYKKFLEEVKNNIKDYLPDSFKDATVQLKTVTKNNGIMLDGLTVVKPNRSANPVLYMNEFYEDMQQGLLDFDGVCQRAAEIIAQNQKKFRIQDILNPEKAKDMITFSVVGAKNNISMLQNTPHRMKDDMAIIYRVVVNQGKDGIGSAIVTEQYAKHLNLNENDLYKIAMENTPKLLPAKMNDLFEEVKKMSAAMMPNDFDMAKLDLTDVAPHLYVLTNKENLDGAAAIFYPGVQEEIYKNLKSEYYVIPSSIHETLILPKNGALLGSHELRAMVDDVNRTHVAPDEVLTDNVYEYDARSKTLTIANDERYRVNTKDIVKAGFKPTKTLVKNMESLNKSVGRNCSLKDAKELAQDAKASTITKDIAKDIVKECQVQEMTMDLPTR